MLIHLLALLFPVHPKPYCPPPCERCGTIPATQRGLCDDCIEQHDSPCLFI